MGVIPEKKSKQGVEGIGIYRGLKKKHVEIPGFNQKRSGILVSNGDQEKLMQNLYIGLPASLTLEFPRDVIHTILLQNFPHSYTLKRQPVKKLWYNFIQPKKIVFSISISDMTFNFLSLICVSKSHDYELTYTPLLRHYHNLCLSTSGF